MPISIALAYFTKQKAPGCPDAFLVSIASASKGRRIFLLTVSDVGANGSELGLESGCQRWHDGNQNQGHESSDQNVFDGGCAGLVFKKLLQHLKLSIWYSAPSNNLVSMNLI